VKLGISSYAYRWAVRTARMDVFALLDRAHDVGVDVVQICDNLPLHDQSDEALADLARRADHLDLDLEIGIKGSQPENLRRHLAIAKRLDARLLRVVLTTDTWSPPLDDLVGVLEGMCSDLHEASVTLAVENHFHLSPDELAGLVQAVDDPLIGVCLDPLNAITKLVGVPETIETLAPFAVSAHAKDAVITRPRTGFYISGCPLGEGLVDLAGLVSAVRRHNPAANVLVECWMDRLDDEETTLAQEERWVRQSVSHLNQLLERMGGTYE